MTGKLQQLSTRTKLANCHSVQRDLSKSHWKDILIQSYVLMCWSNYLILVVRQLQFHKVLSPQVKITVDTFFRTLQANFLEVFQPHLITARYYRIANYNFVELHTKKKKVTLRVTFFFFYLGLTLSSHFERMQH